MDKTRYEDHLSNGAPVKIFTKADGWIAGTVTASHLIGTRTPGWIYVVQTDQGERNAPAAFVRIAEHPLARLLRQLVWDRKDHRWMLRP